MELEDAEPIGLSMRMLMLAVFAGIASVALAASFVPEPYQWGAMILLPAATMGIVLPKVIQRWTIIPVEAEILEATEGARLARRELHQERSTRAALRELDRGLDQAVDETEALALVHQALNRQQLDRACELHLVEPVDPVLSLRVATSAHALPGERLSPWDSVAARTGTTLCYETTDRLDACPHLRSRVRQPQSAVAVPLQATGRLLGVLYLFDREGAVFTTPEVTELEDLAAIVAARIAVLRAAAPAKLADAADRLTGLPDRAAMQDRMIRLLETRQPFTLAVADIDGFGALNVAFGREAGDRVLRTTAQVARRVLRPDDQVGRIGGDEFLLVFPRTSTADATKALERLREELAITQSTSDDPRITLSIGVIGSATGGTIEALLQRAAGALNHAKGAGGNRVVVAQPAPRV
ncbi:MAG: sensor domain-containing diguanylate cyclase [Actinomycetota bacterium]